jgi:hypothetical protein
MEGGEKEAVSVAWLISYTSLDLEYHGLSLYDRVGLDTIWR